MMSSPAIGEAQQLPPRARALMRIQPDADIEVAEQFDQPVAIRLRQWRLLQRRDIGAQMLGIAGAEQDHVGARLVPREAIGRLGQ